MQESRDEIVMQESRIGQTPPGKHVRKSRCHIAHATHAAHIAHTAHTSHTPSGKHDLDR